MGHRRSRSLRIALFRVRRGESCKAGTYQRQTRVRPYLWIAVGIGAMIFALVIYAVAALWGEHLFDVPDLRFHVRQAFSARQMLEHGQLLLQYSNDPPLGLQPSFLHYTSSWYTISGLFQINFA